jgi:dihydrofolate reductase
MSHRRCNYEFQVPVFVLTHHPPRVSPKQNEHLTFTFVTDGIESAVAQATAVAGHKAVLVVGGAKVAQQLLDAGLVDELHLDIMPVFLGTGRRFFESRDLERVQLQKIDSPRGRSENEPQVRRQRDRASYWTSREVLEAHSAKLHGHALSGSRRSR